MKGINSDHAPKSIGIFTLKVDCPALDFPIAETGGIGATAAAIFCRRLGLRFRLPAFLSFLQRALGRWGQRSRWSFFLCGGVAIVVLCVLHLSDHWMVY